MIRRTETSVLLVYSKIVFPHPPAGNLRVVFSSIHCENLVEPLEARLTKHGTPLTGFLWRL